MANTLSYRNRNNNGFIGWLIFAFVLIFLSRVHAYPPEFQSVCEIQESGGQGSGTLIANNDKASLVLTVHHVANEPGHRDYFLWLNAGGKVTQGITLATLPDPKDARWETGDLALAVCVKPLTKQKHVIKPAKVAEFDSHAGPWYAVGFVGEELKVIKIRTCKYVDGLLEFPTLFIPGMSGGPIFDSRGKVVGVISSYCKELGISKAISGPNLQKITSDFLD